MPNVLASGWDYMEFVIIFLLQKMKIKFYFPFVYVLALSLARESLVKNNLPTPILKNLSNFFYMDIKGNYYYHD